MSEAAQETAAICTRLLPYSTHQVRSMQRCGKPATDNDKDGNPICPIHRGADVRGEQNRQRAKDRHYRRLGINPASMNFED